MSNVDLHPLSLPVNRLSPARSNSSIVEQFAHHQHGKGDSAYSSFSGGSNAPDYPPSLHFPDDLQSSSFSHYADLKYIKSMYHPTQGLQANAKTMDQLYRSMEVISQNYRNSTYKQNGNASFYNNDKTMSKMPHRGPSQGDYTPIGPHPIPSRPTNFTAAKNVENGKGQHNSDTQQLRSQTNHHLGNVPQTGMAKPETVNSVISPKMYSDHRAVPAVEVQQLPSTHSHCPSYEQNTVPVNHPNLFIQDNKAPSQQQKSMNFPKRSPPKGTSQSEHSKLSSGGRSTSQDHSHTDGVRSEFDDLRNGLHSAYDRSISEPVRVSSPWTADQTGFINSSITHKGQFYFVTGMYKQSEARMRKHSASVSGSEAASECSTLSERPRERERCHSTMENLFIPIKQVLDERGKDTIPRSSDQENHKPASLSTRSSQSLDSFEEIDTESREIGRHTTTNPIFYCGPEKNSPHSTLQTKDVTSLNFSEPSKQLKGKEQLKKGIRQPLTDVASDRINKETTPLLYHLTEANRTTFKSKMDAEFVVTDKETTRNATCVTDVSVKNGKPPQGDTTKNDTGVVDTLSCNTLDDSYKKYYKEKLKDAQSKVLKETSFKRRDLQLASSHRPRPKPELRSPVIHSFSPSQDSETSTDTITPSVVSEDTERGSIVEEVRQSPKQMNTMTERENRGSANVAQPQVASRIGGRKRLTPEQKKMCYSEPEKLNQLGGGPSHSACRSFGNESDSLYEMDGDWQDHLQPREQGLVAARRKLFETRGRAQSAPSASRTNLKHLQHQALVEYMERKTGQKVAEPQQPGPQVLVPPRQRHSLGERPFDWVPRPLSASTEGNPLKKKLNRPQSAGRILDSSTSSVRYAQFFSAQPSPGPPAGQSNQTRWKERQYRSHGMYASMESLLDQPEAPIFRNRSTSTPHPFQALGVNKNVPVNSTETCSVQKSMSSTPDAHRQIRVVAQRGKSMEELGASKLTRLSTLSKSSEQLDQACREVGNSSLFAEVKEAQGMERGWKKYALNLAKKETDISDLKGPAQFDTEKKSNLNPASDPAPVDGEEIGLKPTTGRRNLSGSHSPTSCWSSRGKRKSSGSRSPPTDKFLSSKPPLEVSHCLGGQETIEREVRSTMFSTTQMKQPCENKMDSRGVHSSPDQSVVEASKDVQPPAHEVSLSCGVTTDPSLWIFPSEEDQPKEDVKMPKSDFNESSISCQKTEASVSTGTSISDEQAAEEKKPKRVDSDSRDNQEIEDSGITEVETSSSENPAKRPSWEELVEAVVKVDQSLTPALYPLTNRKTALMLMEQLLSEDTLLMEEHYKKKQEQKEAAESCETKSPPSQDGLKAASSTHDPASKKSMLVCYIEEHLGSLEETRDALQVEIQDNVAHGKALEALVRERCLPLELERYNLFIGDLERVVNLLLCLSARLARVQNALSTVDEETDAEEKQSLDSRHRLLCKQREDAKDLKDNLDRRESLVSTFLSRQLSAEQVRDYRRFVQTKASLLIRRKDLEEKTRLCEEQLEALAKSLRF
ncbi:protein Shroom1 isoform X2 [Corythoichthys intestinalis]|nr:protein Shroom1 isoform X2 [Corythoichthys intestinalis]XP_057676514.1 protein Shroom1 isoform X2 [Corythoichthys intestinalis]